MIPCSAKQLLQDEAELSDEAREGKRAEGIDTVHVLQDALLLLLAPSKVHELITQEAGPRQFFEAFIGQCGFAAS